MYSISLTFDFIINFVAADKHIETLDDFNDDMAHMNAIELPKIHDKTVIIKIIIVVLL